MHFSIETMQVFGQLDILLIQSSARALGAIAAEAQLLYTNFMV